MPKEHPRQHVGMCVCVCHRARPQKMGLQLFPTWHNSKSMERWARTPNLTEDCENQPDSIRATRATLHFGQHMAQFHHLLTPVSGFPLASLQNLQKKTQKKKTRDLRGRRRLAPRGLEARARGPYQRRDQSSCCAPGSPEPNCHSKGPSSQERKKNDPRPRRPKRD